MLSDLFKKKLIKNIKKWIFKQGGKKQKFGKDTKIVNCV